MDIIITNTNNQPIYEQIYNQVKGLIISGELKEGAPLPSIRNMAKDLKISVITTKRAYEELEKDGYIYTAPGKGSYVAEKNLEMLRESQLREIEEHMRKIVELAPSCRLTQDETLEMFKIFMEEMK